MNNNDKFSFNIKEDDINEVIDEKKNGNAFVALRKVSWGGSPHKLEIRKWVIDNTGNEKPMKGVSFFNEDEGTNNLINVLLKNNYGNTVDVLSSIKDRDNFKDSLNKVMSGEVNNEEDNYNYYDPKEALL